MTTIVKKLKEQGIAGLLFVGIVVYGLFYLYQYLNNKGMIGDEFMSSNTQQAYNNKPTVTGPRPAESQGLNEVFSAVNGSGANIPNTNTKLTNQNPSDLLPKDTNTQWSQLNPIGKGDLANINLLKAGHHIGIDTVGQTLRNGNLQIRSEEPNPQVNTGPWNQSTIESDTMRPKLELGR